MISFIPSVRMAKNVKNHYRHNSVDLMILRQSVSVCFFFKAYLFESFFALFSQKLQSPAGVEIVFHFLYYIKRYMYAACTVVQKKK